MAGGSAGVPAGALVGIDIGGTFTDIVAVEGDGRLHVLKVRSTPDDFSLAIADGLASMLRTSGLPAAAVERVSHGTTVATNAVLEGKGARTGLLTTEGFRDVLEIGRVQAPVLYDLEYEKPAPLVPRKLRAEVDERVDGTGCVVRALDIEQAEALIEALVGEGVESLAVCLVNSYVNPEHEQVLGKLAAERFPELYCTLSHELLREMGEYERTSTAVVNSYVMPIVDRYLERLGASLTALGISGAFSVMGSSGGLMEAGEARTKPALMIESGPAAGVIAARGLAGATAYKDLITFDMGGTTAKASLVEDGRTTVSPQLEVGGGMSFGNELTGGGGYPVRSTVVDLTEVGAGGGSIVWVDEAGGMHVGPHSAGADPGPACYGRGGDAATVTDAGVVLGYVNDHAIAGGTVEIRRDLAVDALGRVAERLGVALDEAARGVYEIASANMMRAIRAVSVERGRDPRGFALLAFGGNGPLFGAHIAETMGMGRVIVPPWAGVFSVIGLLTADTETHEVVTVRLRLDECGDDEVRDRIAAVIDDHATASGGAVEHRVTASARYVGQRYELDLPLEPREFGTITAAELAARFHATHERNYGHRNDSSPVELVNIRLAAVESRGLPFDAVTGQRRPPAGAAGQAPAPTRQLYFDAQAGRVAAQVLATRADLPAGGLTGPCVIEEEDSTTLVPPGWGARLDDLGNVVLEREGTRP